MVGFWVLRADNQYDTIFRKQINVKTSVMYCPKM